MSDNKKESKKSDKEEKKNTSKNIKSKSEDIKNVKEKTKQKAKEETNKEVNGTTNEQNAQQVSQQKSKGNKTAIIHVFSSKNDTIITATDLSGAETIAWSSGGSVVSADREEGRPYAAMQAMIKVINTLKDRGINKVQVWVRAPGGNKSKTPGSGVQVAIRTLARSKMRILRIEDVTPLPTDSMRRKGGRRGRRV